MPSEQLKHFACPPLSCTAVLLISLLLAPTTAADHMAIPVAGEPFVAELEKVDAKWNITFVHNATRRVITADNLVSWAARVDVRPGPLLLLTDGSILPVSDLQIERDRAQAATENWGEPHGADLWSLLKIPRDSIAGYIVRPPSDVLARDRLIAQINQYREKDDQVWLENGDLVVGKLQSLGAGGPMLPENENDAADDAIGSVTSIATESGIVSLPTERINRICFRATDRSKRIKTSAILGMRDGAKLMIAQVGDAGTTRLTLACGVMLPVSPDVVNVWTDVVSLRPLSPRVTYLSDLRPVSYKHTPLLSTRWLYQNDSSVVGGALRSQQHVYSKGLGMHGSSRLTYRLSRAYSQFAADLAIDSTAGAAGSVVYRVFTFGTSRSWKEAYRSDVVRGGQAPTAIKVDVAGATHLTLVVARADRGDVLDRANWLGARLVESGLPRQKNWPAD